MRMQTKAPSQKIVASTLTAAIVTAVAWGLEATIPDLKIPEHVQEAFTVILVFVVGYMTPPAARDQIKSSSRPTVAGPSMS